MKNRERVQAFSRQGSAGADCIRPESNQTTGAECRQAVKDLLQNLVQWVYKMADKMPVEKILDVILR